MNRLSLVFAAVSLVAVMGCNSSAPATSSDSKTAQSAPKTVPAPDGTMVDTSDFSLVLPKTWEAVDFGDKELVSSMEAAWAKDEKLKGMIPQIKQMQANGSIKLFAFDKDTLGKGFATNINVIVLDQMAVPLEKLVEANVTQMKSMANADIKTSNLKGKNCDVALLDWGMKNANGDLHFFTCLAIKGSKNYTLTFTTKEGEQEKLRKTMETVASTLELK